MKKNILKSKSWYYSVILKILGCCGVLILFEACYGTPKAAWIPRYDKNKTNAQLHKATDICKTTIDHKNK